jgi:hypothetical protein
VSLATIIPQAQAAVVSAGIVKNVLAGLTNRFNKSGLQAINKDISGFEFDYLGDEDLDASNEITKHYTESNVFMQDHRAVGPTVLTFRGFVAETTFNKSGIVGSVLGLSAALSALTPYLGQYAPGATSKMADAVNKSDQVIEQLAQIASVGGSLLKIANAGNFGLSRVQKAYDQLETLRRQEAPFIVVTPWAVYGDPSFMNIDGTPYHGPMMIESLRLRSPEETRSWADIVVRLVEIRTAPSLQPETMDNARGSQLPAYNGVVGQVS